jgi:hypothetical protein
MFVLQPKPTFKQPVTIQTTDGDATVTFVFKHKGRKALAVFFDSLGGGETGETGETARTARTDLDALQELVEGWEGVDTPFDAAALDTLLDNYPTAARAIFDGYNKGLFEGRQKNS